MERAIARPGELDLARRLAVSVALAMALLVGALYLGLGVRLFVWSRTAWVLAALPAGVAIAALWTAAASRRRDRWLADLAHGAVAAIIAGVLIIYVVAKIYGGQFGPPLEVELDTRLRDLSGFQLTWRFFGYSFAYAMFVAAGQGLGAALLCFARTRLLGACLLAPILANIAVLNVTHHIPVRLLSTVLLVLDLYLVAALGGRRLVAFFFGGHVTPRPFGPVRWQLAAIKAALLVAWFAAMAIQFAALRESVWQKSPVHGTWDVVEVSRDRGAPAASHVGEWQRIYFENYRHDGRHVGSTRTPAGLVWFHYRAGGGAIEIELSMRKLEGRYQQRDGRSMVIRGRLGDRPVELRLRRIE